MNSVNLIGRAVQAPSLKYVGATNQPLAEFTLAVDDTHSKPDPNTGKRPTFFFLVLIWGNKADIAAAHITKGRRTGITGRLSQETFTPKGTTSPVTKTRIIADSFDLLDKPAPHPEPSHQPPPSDPAEEIPF